MLGVGKLSGYTKYQIGGKVDTQLGSTELHFPLSELDFPLDLSMVSAGLSKELSGKWKVSLDIKKNITSDAGTMKDSDWGLFYLYPEDFPEPIHAFQQNTLDVYSESDADLNAFIVDVELRYRFIKKSNWSFSGGLGYIYQYFHYDVSDVDEWYPSFSYYFGEDSPHKYYSGKALTYEVSSSIPYLEVAAEVKIKDKFSIEGSLGYAPHIHVADEDNHILRSKISKGDLYGDAVMVSLEARYNFTNDWFLTLKFNKTTIDAEGRSKSYFYDVYTHTIDQEIESEQRYTILSIGYVF
jgi:outer membrane protease